MADHARSTGAATLQRGVPLMSTPLYAQVFDQDPDGWECYVTLLAEGQLCQMWLTRYEKDEPIYTITTSGEDLLHCCRKLVGFQDWADTDFKDSKLILPHMGDFQIDYHT